MIVTRIVAVFTALILVAAAAHGTIVSTGGYGTPQAYATIAVAVGVVVASGVIGHVRSWMLACVLFLCLVAGEGYALLNTANRVVAASDAAQAPLMDAKQRHDAALKALTDAEAEKPAPASRARLTAAEKAKSDADKAAREQASLPGCRKNCADLLQAAVDNAAREIESARAELAGHDSIESQRIAAKIVAAKAALKDAPLPPSATPFADRVGLPPWIIDLSSAFLLSIGLNGLAAGLIAFAVHQPREATAEKHALAPVEAPRVLRSALIAKGTAALPPPAKTPALSIRDFGAENLEPAPGGTLDFDEFFNAYTAAAKAEKKIAYGPVEFVEPFKKLCDEAGIRVRRRGEKVLLCDVRLTS